MQLRFGELDSVLLTGPLRGLDRVCLDPLVRIVEGRNKQNRPIEPAIPERSADFEAGQLRQAYIEKNDIGPFLQRLRERFDAVLGHQDFEVVTQALLEERTDEWIIIGQQHPPYVRLAYRCRRQIDGGGRRHSRFDEPSAGDDLKRDLPHSVGRLPQLMDEEVLL